MNCSSVAKQTRRRLLNTTFPSLIAALLPGAAFAAYPDHTIKLVVPWPPGGITDVTARLLAQRMAVDLQQTIVVENVPGASGTIGHAAVAQSSADGYSVLLATNSTYAMAPYLLPKIPYGETAFRAIGLVARSPQIFCGHPAQPFQDMAGFLAYAREKPAGSVSFESSGPGSSSHLATELMMSMAGINMLHVPYRGGGPAMQALLSGEVNVGFVDAVIAIPFHKQSQLRLLGASAVARMPQLADVPTISESGVPGFQSSTDLSMLVPAATPDPIVARLSASLVAALKSPEVHDKLTDLGADVVAGTPDQFSSYLTAESKKWGDVIRSRGIKLQ